MSRRNPTRLKRVLVSVRGHKRHVKKIRKKK